MRIDTLIIGGGQAGLALSRLFTFTGREHVVLERGRVGERWRSERWDSLALLTPNWLNRLPGAREAGDPGAFLDRDGFVAELEHYARSFDAPVREGTAVVRVRRHARGFHVETTDGAWDARNVVIATGYCDLPRLPEAADSAPARLAQVHASRYRSPQALPEGEVLVVGAGASGQQIAFELAQAGRAVTLAVGRHSRVPRRYRGRDIMEWLGALGHFERTFDELPHPASTLRAPSLPLDGRDGGRDLDLAVLAGAGVRLTGRLTGFDGDRACFQDDLSSDVTHAEQRMRATLEHIDELPEAAQAPPATLIPPVPLGTVPTSLDLARTSAVIWATGYRRAYPWLEVDVLDGRGELIHDRGVTPVPGLYALGLRWQHRMTSHQINGVGRDAAYLSSHLASRLTELAA